ncbi:VOC family protein [Lactococcus insecticola]|uniref:Lactoylglutathione lyase n=1 Tax=Pseudolactococcus insecticola TaxID=2709158 RepID=A0A6A0B720_9LACT|nr:VOC family protein [Lactococcus insecticola]GFH40746.1 lactoylglutathione lyase [Lactococcus insecticola]
MINAALTLMLYVNDVKAAVAFWTALGFSSEVIDENSAQIKSDDTSQVTFMLYDKAFIRQVSPEVVDNVPSILFQTSDLDGLYDKVLATGNAAGEIVDAPGMGRVFNFSDPDGAYYAVVEVNAENKAK